MWSTERKKKKAEAYIYLMHMTFNHQLKIIKQSKRMFSNPASTTRQLIGWRWMVCSILLSPYVKISTPSLIFNPSTLPASQLLAIGFYNLSLGSEELLPLSMEEKGCYSRVTLVGSSRFQALMDSLHWGKADAVLLVLRLVRSIYLCHWYHLLESQ